MAPCSGRVADGSMQLVPVRPGKSDDVSEPRYLRRIALELGTAGLQMQHFRDHGRRRWKRLWRMSWSRILRARLEVVGLWGCAGLLVSTAGAARAGVTSTPIARRRHHAGLGQADALAPQSLQRAVINSTIQYIVGYKYYGRIGYKYDRVRGTVLTEHCTAV